MKFRLHGNQLINTEIVSPIIPYAEFSQQLANGEKEEILLNLNYGSQMIEIYRKNRNNMHIVNVVDTLKEMEYIFTQFDYEMFRLKGL